MIIHMTASISKTTIVPTVPSGDIILHNNPPRSPPLVFSSAHVSNISPSDEYAMDGLSVILIIPAASTITSAYTAVDLTLATASMSLLETMNINVTASMIGNIYSIIPIIPNMNHLIHAPTLPARLKLLSSNTSEHARAIRITISSFSGLATTFLRFFDVVLPDVLLPDKEDLVEEDLVDEDFLAPLVDVFAGPVVVVRFLDLLLLALVELPVPAKTNSSVSLHKNQINPHHPMHYLRIPDAFLPSHRSQDIHHKL